MEELKWECVSAEVAREVPCKVACEELEEELKWEYVVEPPPEGQRVESLPEVWVAFEELREDEELQLE